MSKINRRKFLKLAVSGTAGVCAGAPMINFGKYRLFPNSQDNYSARAVELMEQATVIDALSPLSLQYLSPMSYLVKPNSFSAEDFKKYKSSGIDVFHPAIGMGDVPEKQAVLGFFSGWNSFIAEYDEFFMRIDSAEDFIRLKKSDKIGIILGLQNSDHFVKLSDVKFFHSMGQRISQLTYNVRNLIGSGSTERSDGGISDFGVRIITQMQRVGIAVDVSHCGDKTTLDTFEVATKPVLITHSNCRALCEGHVRCKTDEAIKRMGETGGVMGITGVRMFVRAQEPTTIEHYLDHFDHVAKLIGIEHVGVGSDSDLDGYDDMPEQWQKALRAGYKDLYRFREKIDIEGIDHPKRMYDLTEGLIRRGYSDNDIVGVIGGNFKRVLSELWAV